MLLVPRGWPEAGASALPAEAAIELPLAYNPAMSEGDNGVWALGDVRPLRGARVVTTFARHFAEMLPALLSGAAAAVVAPPADMLVPRARARLVALPDAPLVETAVCWRAGDEHGDVPLLAAAVAGALAAWARRQQRARRPLGAIGPAGPRDRLRGPAGAAGRTRPQVAWPREGVRHAGQKLSAAPRLAILVSRFEMISLPFRGPLFPAWPATVLSRVIPHWNGGRALPA